MVPVGLAPQTTVVKPKAPELKALRREVALAVAVVVGVATAVAAVAVAVARKSASGSSKMGPK